MMQCLHCLRNVHYHITLLICRRCLAAKRFHIVLVITIRIYFSVNATCETVADPENFGGGGFEAKTSKIRMS